VLASSVAPEHRRSSAKKAQSVSAVVTASQDHTLRVWEVPVSGERITGDNEAGMASGECVCVLEGHRGTVECVSVCPVEEKALGYSERRFCSGGADGVIHLWSSSAPENDSQVDDEDSDLSASQKKRRVGDGADSSPGAAPAPVVSPLATLSLPTSTQMITGVAWVQPTQVISAGYDGFLRVWDASTQKIVHELVGAASPALCMSAHPDTQLVVTGHADSTVRLWDPRAGSTSEQQMQSQLVSGDTFLTGKQGFVSCVAWHPDTERMYAAGTHGGSLALFDVRSSVPLHSLRGHTDKVLACSWVSDAEQSRQLVSGGADREIRAWKVPLQEGSYAF
jgi:ribosome biogenesis protein